MSKLQSFIIFPSVDEKFPRETMSPCLKIPEFYPAFVDRRHHHLSKALYGTTGGTYSARVFRPVFLFNWALTWEIMRRSTSPGQLTGI